MKHSLELEPLRCPQCGRQMRVGEAVTEPDKIRQLLSARAIVTVDGPPPAARAPPAGQLLLPWPPSRPDAPAA